MAILLQHFLVESIIPGSTSNGKKPRSQSSKGAPDHRDDVIFMKYCVSVNATGLKPFIKFHILCHESTDYFS